MAIKDFFYATPLCDVLSFSGEGVICSSGQFGSNDQIEFIDEIEGEW